MTDPTNPAAVVEQVDRDAVQSFHREMYGKLLNDIATGKPYKMGEDEGDNGSLVQAFARHRLLGIEQGRAEMREEALAHVVTTRTRHEHGKHCCCVTCELNEAEDGIRAIPTAKERG